MPYHAARALPLNRLMRNSADTSGFAVTRLIDDRREALGWSLYTVLGRDARTGDVIRRFARRRIMTVGDLIKLPERVAFSIARTDVSVWFRMRREITALGLSFGYGGENIVTYRKATRQGRTAAH